MKKSLINDCREKLLKLKSEHEEVLNRTPSSNEISYLIRQRKQVILSEINLALNRIKEGTFGYCQRTGDPITERRLMAIPWTRSNTVEEEDFSKVS